MLRRTFAILPRTFNEYMQHLDLDLTSSSNEDYVFVTKCLKERRYSELIDTSDKDLYDHCEKLRSFVCDNNWIFTYDDININKFTNKLIKVIDEFCPTNMDDIQL